MSPMTPNEALQQAKQALDRALEIKRQNEAFLRSIGPAIIDALKPVLEDVRNSISNIKVNVEPTVTVMPKIEMPDIHIPDIKVPAPQVTVKVPEIKIPKIVMPKFEFPKDIEMQGFLKIIGWDRSLLETPLPVQIRDAKGRAVDFSAIGGGGVVVEGGGGAFQYPTIAGFLASSFAELMNPDGRVKVELPSGVSGLTNTELRAAAVEIQQVSGANWSVSVSDIFGSTAANVINPDGRIKVELPTGSSGLTDTELRASAVPIMQVSGANWSVNVSGFSASIFSIPGNAEGVAYNGDNPLPVTFAASTLIVQQLSGAVFSVNNVGPIAQGEAATALRVVVAGDSDMSVYVRNPAGTGEAATALRVVVAGDSDMSVFVRNPVDNGDSATALRVVIAGNSSSSVVVNNPQGPGEQATALRVLVAGDSSASVSVRDFNGNAPATGLNETNAGVLRVVVMTDSVTSVYVNNPVAQGDAATALRVVVAGNSDMSVVVNNPQNQGDAATALRVVVAGNSDMSTFSLGGTTTAAVLTRTANPTAVTADLVPMSADKLGRPIMRPVQMRDLTKTAYVALSTGSETTLLAAVAGAFLDLIMIAATNNSTAATQLDIRATTGGNIIHTMYLPASTGPVGWSPSVPWPQDNQGNNWTIDMPDQTGTTVYVSALFSQEI